MYELIILSVLMQMPVHGFLIAKIINDAIGPVARASNGRIYPLLNKLAAEGHVEVHEEKTSDNGLPMRIYRITERGRQRFHEIMLDVNPSPREYRELFALKVTGLSFLQKDERIHIIDRYSDFCRKHISHFVSEIVDFRERSKAHQVQTAVDGTVASMEHSLHQWVLELAWATKLRSQETGEAAPTVPAEQKAELLAALKTLVAELEQ